MKLTRLGTIICLSICLSQPLNAQTAKEKGIAALQQGNYQQAIAEFRRKIQRRDTVDPEIMGYLALAYQKTGAIEEATKAIDELEALSTSIEQGLAAKINNLISLIYIEQGNYSLAAQKLDRAAEYYQKKDSTAYAGTQINLAIALQKLGKNRQSANLLERINSQLKPQGQDLTYLLQHNLAIAHSSIGNYDRAIASFEEAAKSADDNRQKSQTLVAHAKLIGSSQPKESSKMLQKAIKIGDLSTKIAGQLALARINTSQQQWSKIQNNIDRLPPTLVKDKYQIKLAKLLISNQIKTTNLQAKLEPIASNSLTRERSQAYGLLGQMTQTEAPQVARQHYQQALKLAKKAQAQDLSYQWLWQLGRTETNHQQALENYAQAVKDLNSVRGNLIGYSTENQINYQQEIEPLYREYVSLLVENPSQKNLIAARNTIESLQSAELENYFRSACLTAITEQIDGIDPKAATIYPIVLKDKLAVISTIAGKLSYKSFPVTPQEVEQTVAQFSLNLHPSRSTRKRKQLGNKLYSWLIAPNKSQLQQTNIETLVFVLDKELRNLPLAAINTETGYLVEDYAIALTPGLQLLPSKELETEQLEAVVGGLSVEQDGYGALPGVEKEVELIANQIKTKPLINQQFTEINLQKSLKQTRQAPLLHLATHGQFSSNPENTYILTWKDRLNINELEQLLKVRDETPKLVPIELLILSACKTATGDSQAALGLAGMAIKSGARSTIGSLWSVSDQSTTLLMDKIYHELKQQEDKGNVLRQAQLSLLESENHNHPYFWSPFVLVGNWN